MGHRKYHRRSGFTIVELLVVIVVIGILSSITILVYASQSKSSRDAQRVASVTAIASALENYYSQNGEYPSCTVINSSSATLTALPALTAQTLISPKASTGSASSLLCGTALSPSSMGDKYVYVGDGSSICNTGSSCRYWTLQYWKEADNTVGSINSKHQAATVNVAAPTGVSTTPSQSGNTVNGTPQAACAQGTAQYGVRYRINSGTWSNYTSFTSSQTPLAVSTAVQGDEVDFQTQARCYLTSEYISPTTTGASVAYIVPIAVPGTPTNFAQAATTATVNGYTNVTASVTWNEPTCGTGTVRRLNLGVAYFVSASAPPNATSYSSGFGSYTGQIWSTPANAQTNWNASSPGGYLTSYYSTASSVPSADVVTPANNFGLSGSNTNDPAWVTWGVSSSSPLQIGSGDWSSSQQNTKLTFLRVYARYACVNTTTQRYAIGAYTFSPAWTWSSY